MVTPEQVPVGTRLQCMETLHRQGVVRIGTVTRVFLDFVLIRLPKNGSRLRVSSASFHRIHADGKPRRSGWSVIVEDAKEGRT